MSWITNASAESVATLEVTDPFLRADDIVMTLIFIGVLLVWILGTVAQAAWGFLNDDSSATLEP